MILVLRHIPLLLLAYNTLIHLRSVNLIFLSFVLSYPSSRPICYFFKKDSLCCSYASPKNLIYLVRLLFMLSNSFYRLNDSNKKRICVLGVEFLKLQYLSLS